MKRLILMITMLLLAVFARAQIEFDITAFSDTTKYGWANYDERSDYRTDLLDRQKLLHLYELEAQSLNANILKSALVPGWGQFSTKQPIKAEIILGLEIVAVGTSLFFYDRSMNYYRKYENATQINDIYNYYKKAQAPYQYSIISLGLGFIVWVYNIYDVVQSTETYNAEIWRDIQERHKGSNLQIGPDGIELRF
ncbi:MAG: hypothetical protein CVU49_08640 [Candidatus Cloacimonetes bacterium HGW-Cloacimonetes-2]|jgi:hypothetical protein|nr:MAG: hypothetical protein CVU49_08640 [Candidatus Cloacimonetes bacterium HGW-Cloacimonetes-2]